MPDITVEIVIPEAHQARMKSAIEWYVAQGLVDTTGVDLDPETGTLSVPETLLIFRRMTYSAWRKYVIRKEKLATVAEVDDIFDPNTIP